MSILHTVLKKLKDSLKIKLLAAYFAQRAKNPL